MTLEKNTEKSAASTTVAKSSPAMLKQDIEKQRILDEINRLGSNRSMLW